jgi:hypothetical protein
MILSIRLHMKEATSSSMIHKVLSLVLRKRLRLLGTLLRSGLLQPSWRISCMQFGILAVVLSPK